ncbi:snaclec coagulation factor IX/factor X-binding protein subunit A isoform X1 [Anabrus simplex]|uniref:snaclec coagulation factor IX/factor X-binding protein subunit A isoform X1 n=1 Tax=Anabrus simplex TaxID=316456 RepID=UPI0035A28741
MKIIWVLLLVLVDTRRFASTENQEKRSYDSNEMKQLDSVTSVHPPLHGTSMSQGIEPVTPSNTTPAAATTTKPKFCPHSGYQLFGGFNCYKRYHEIKSWSDAREQCKSDGGDLMVVESERERKEVIPSMFKNASSKLSVWMGVYRLLYEDRWETVKGEPALSSWWAAGEPNKRPDHMCADTNSSGLLHNWDCDAWVPYICEIPL